MNIKIVDTRTTEIHNFEVRYGDTVIKCHNLGTAKYYQKHIRRLHEQHRIHRYVRFQQSRC